MLNPFFIRLNLTVQSTPSEFVDRLNTRIKTLELKDGFEKSLHPMGAVMGFSSETHFELQEAMYGYGGATATGTLATTPEGTTIKGVVRPGLYLRIGFGIISIIYVLICLMYGSIVHESGVSFGRLVAFSAYTLVFIAIWQLTVRDTKGLVTFLRDIGEADIRG